MIGGGTLKFLLERDGTQVQTMDSLAGPQNPDGGVTLHVHVYQADRDRRTDPSRYLDLKITLGPDEGDHWVVDDGDCGLDHDDIIDLVLHCHQYHM